MTAIVSAFSTVLDLFGDVFDFIIDQPLLLLFLVIPLVGVVIYLILSIFRR